MYFTPEDFFYVFIRLLSQVEFFSPKEFSPGHYLVRWVKVRVNFVAMDKGWG